MATEIKLSPLPLGGNNGTEIIDPESRKCIARIFHDPEIDDLALARQFCAAPALVEALRGILFATEDDRKGRKKFLHANTGKSFSQYFADAKSAIALAEGEA